MGNIGGGKKEKRNGVDENDAQRRVLSESQVEAVRKTWKVVARDLQGNGIAFFVKVFDIAPEAQQLFAPFRDVPREELPKHDAVKKHALGVMETVGAAVDSIDDIDSLTPILLELGAKHVKWNIQDPHFDIVGQALLSAIEKANGDDWTPSINDAWTFVYNWVADVMKEGMRQERSEN